VDTQAAVAAPVAFASAAPSAEAVVASAGALDLSARGDHAHPRLTSVTVQSTDSGGNATVTFTRTFTKKPGVILEGYDSGSQPLTFTVSAFQQDGSLNYSGCTIKAYRSQVVPQNLATLLLGGVFNLFGGTVGVVEFSCVAIQASN
jgi:hypothetical protein